MSANRGPVSRILHLLRMERKEISAVYFYAILSGLIQLSLPLGIQAIISYVLGAAMRASLYVLIALVVIGVLAAGLMQVTQMKIIEKIQQKIFVRYSFAFAEHIPRIDLKKTDNIYLPELVNRFFEIPVLQKSLAKILLDIPTASIQILFGLILLSFYHPAFILFGALLIIVLWLILRYSGDTGLQTSLEESSSKYRVAGWLQETARAIRSIKLAKASDLHSRKTDEQVVEYLDARNKHFKILLFQYHVLVAFKTVITAAMLIVGTMLLLNQQLNIGQFIAAEIVVLLVLNAVEKMIINLGTVYDTLTSVEKIAKLTDKPAEKSGSVKMEATGHGLKLEMKELTFSYNERSPVLRNINLQVNPGEKVCITGPGSSGKSSLLRLMAGVYSDFEGSFLLDDVPLGNYEVVSMRSQIGVMLNQQDIFHGTLWENIALGKESIEMSTVVNYAEMTGLQQYIETLKEGYDTVLDPTGNRLPRNIIHKILLVRSLAAKPRLLLLEEPLVNMEPIRRRKVLDSLLHLPGTTLVVVSGDSEFAAQCDKVVVLEKGNVSIVSNKTK